MRGSDATSGLLLSWVDLESRVPSMHPLRVIKAIVDDVLVSLDDEFERLCPTRNRRDRPLVGCALDPKLVPALACVLGLSRNTTSSVSMGAWCAWLGFWASSIGDRTLTAQRL